jgi:hypothetical protein
LFPLSSARLPRRTTSESRKTAIRGWERAPCQNSIWTSSYPPIGKAKGCRGKATPGAFDRLSARLIRLCGNRRQLIGKGTRNTGRHLDANCDQSGRMPIVEHVQGHFNISTQGSCRCGFCRPEVVWRKSFEDDAHGMPSRLHSCPDCRTRCMRPELDQQYKRHCSVRISHARLASTRQLV